MVCHSSGFIAYLDLPSRQNTQRGGHVNFRGLLPSISHRRLPISLFVLFNLLLLLLSLKNIAFRRRANEGKVFICVHDSRCFRDDCVYRSIVYKHCSGAVEHSLYCWILLACVSWPDIRRELGRPLETPVEWWYVARQFRHLWTISLPSHAKDRLLKVPVDTTGQHVVSPLAHLCAISLTALTTSCPWV